VCVEYSNVIDYHYLLIERVCSRLSFKLVDVFERLTNQKAGSAHQAEADVIMLVVCAATLGEKFINWADENSKKFSDIPQMDPMRKIGT